MSYFDTQIGQVLKCRQPVILALINSKVIDRNISVNGNIHILKPNLGDKFSLGFEVFMIFLLSHTRRFVITTVIINFVFL